MDGRPDARGAVSAIAGGPGCAAFFVGGRTWIPAFRGDDGREGVRRWAKGGDRTEAPCAVVRSHRVPLRQVRTTFTTIVPHVRHRPRQMRHTLTTVIPAKAGIQVGFYRYER